MSKTNPTTESNGYDPMENNIIHWLLVNSNRLQQIPAVFIAISIAVFSLIIWLIWNGDDSAPIVTVTFALTCGVDWLGLWLLPRAKRSFGPEKPATLALINLRFVMVVIVSLLSLNVWLIVIGNIALSLIALYATWIEPHRLGVTHEIKKSGKLDPSAPPIRLLHIADIHIERITPRERQLNQRIAELKPDVIVFSGDFVNISYTDDPQAFTDIRTIISEWSAPLGVYCVTGTYTVEPIERVKEFVAGLDNLRLLLDEWVTIETPAGNLNILGMVTTHYLETDQNKIRALAQSAPTEGVNLLLTHSPDVAPQADEQGFDLYMCGHTHGGQMRSPIIGALFTGSHLGRQFVMGRYDLENVTVYTSRGIGLEGLGAPRARFLCPPEIIQWEIGGK